ncbi:MAG: glycosyltransferase, partial [Clostridiales bacterium]
MGHFSAATTLAEQIYLGDPTINIVVRDIYELAFPEYCEMFYRSYMSLVSRGCKLYNFAYKKTVHSNLGQRNRGQLGGAHMASMLKSYIELTQPDVIISTYSLCARMVSDYKRKSGRKIPLITCITDVSIHNVWINPETDIYLVGAAETKQSLLQAGVDEQRIFITGIPVKSRFYASVGAHAQEQTVRPQAQRELLIMGGGLGLLPTQAQFYQQLNRLPGVHTTIIVGKNEKLRKKLGGKYENITVLGFTDQVDRFMRQADLLISKPGGITMFEAINSRLPLLIFRPFLEQEISNAKFLADNGLGIVLTSKPEQAVGKIAAILGDEARLSAIRRNMD